MSKHIVVIPGDGIGTEITDAAVEVLKKIDDIYKIGLTYEWKDAGGAAYDKFGEPLPQDTIDPNIPARRACRRWSEWDGNQGRRA